MIVFGLQLKHYCAVFHQGANPRAAGSSLQGTRLLSCVNNRGAPVVCDNAPLYQRWLETACMHIANNLQ